MKVLSEGQRQHVRSTAASVIGVLRQPKHLSPRFIVVAAENTYIEKQYFQEVLVQPAPTRVVVTVLETTDSSSAPEYVLPRLSEFKRLCEQEGHEFGVEDEFWLMVDVDRHHNLSDIADEAIKLGYKLAISKPCFEVWLLCHLADAGIEENWSNCARQVEPTLRARLDGYAKRLQNRHIPGFRNTIDLAMRRAIELDSSPHDLWPQRTGTHVYKVMHSIFQAANPFPRSGLYAITAESHSSPEQLAGAVQAALRGGAKAIQYRAKSGRNRREEAEWLLAECRAFGVPLIINDDVELALAVKADGVHLGRDDASVAEARQKLGLSAIVGVSCYDSVERALEAERQGASYVAFGRFFPSATKPHAPCASLATLSEAKRKLGVPLVAIGGITPDNGGALLEAGADVLAVVDAVFGAVFGAGDSERAALAFQPLFRA